jgi:hypothetical protein
VYVEQLAQRHAAGRFVDAGAPHAPAQTEEFGTHQAWHADRPVPGAPARPISGTLASVSTWLMSVGALNSPRSVGNGGLARG